MYISEENRKKGKRLVSIWTAVIIVIISVFSAFDYAHRDPRFDDIPVLVFVIVIALIMSFIVSRITRLLFHRPFSASYQRKEDKYYAKKEEELEKARNKAEIEALENINRY